MYVCPNRPRIQRQQGLQLSLKINYVLGTLTRVFLQKIMFCDIYSVVAYRVETFNTLLILQMSTIQYKICLQSACAFLLQKQNLTQTTVFARQNSGRELGLTLDTTVKFTECHLWCYPQLPQPGSHFNPVSLVYFSGRDSAFLDETSFTERLLVRRGSRAQFDCRFSNSILTEWYFGENKRLTNVPNK